VSVLFPGKLDNGGSSVFWDGYNEGGQAVDNGMYTFKLEVTDQFGKTSTFDRQISMVKTGGDNSLVIYNSAGEVVAEVPLTGLPGELVDFSTETSSFALAFDSATGQPRGRLLFYFKTADGSSRTWTWDGKTGLRQPLKSGSYLIRLVTSSPSGGVSVATRAIVVISTGSDAAPQATAMAPNPAADTVNILYKPLPNAQAVAEVFTLAGERVCMGADGSRSGVMTLDISKLAPGIYLVNFTMTEGRGILSRRLMKLAVIK
jgi:hypothetical protein